MAHWTLPPTTQATARRRRPRRLSRLAALPEHLTAAAMDDHAAAEQLMADLLALVDAGLITPVAHEDAIRYTPADPDTRAA